MPKKADKMDRKFTIYVLHKTGVKNHHTGLEYLLRSQDCRLVFREFSIAGTFFKSLIRFKFARVGKQFINLLFLLNLLITKNKRVVVGIAPFDSKLTMLRRVLKNHYVFYHTSWTVWDGTHHPKRKNVTPAVMQDWKAFLESDCRHIFAVSNEAKIRLQENYKIDPDRISVVFHAIDTNKFNAVNLQPKVGNVLKFVYVGRLVRQKGLEELLEYFSNRTDKSFTIIGSGEMQPLVEEYARKHDSISYVGYVSDAAELAEHYKNHHYLVLNSMQTGKWEEAFGIVLIEAMACGVVPIATNHSGPREIIDNSNGFLIAEGEMPAVLDSLDIHSFEAMQSHAIATAALFSEQNISKKWLPVLADYDL